MRPVRVVSLVPSATETLVALGVDPVGCTRFCDCGGRADRRRHEERRRRRGRRARARPRGRERRGEPHRGRRRARWPAVWSLHSMSPRSVADVGPAVCALGRRDRRRAAASVRRLGRVAGAHAPGRRASSAFVPIWRRPWMSLAADTYGSSLLAHVGVVERVRRRGRSLSRGRARATSRRARPSSCCCRASRTRSRSGTRVEVREAIPECRVVLRRRPRPVLVGDPHPGGRRAPRGRSADGARAGADRRPRAGRPPRALGQDRSRVREPRRDRVAPGADGRGRRSGPKISAIVPLEAHARAVAPAADAGRVGAARRGRGRVRRRAHRRGIRGVPPRRGRARRLRRARRDRRAPVDPLAAVGTRRRGRVDARAPRLRRAPSTSSTAGSRGPATTRRA